MLIIFYLVKKSECGICPYAICCPWVRGGRGLDALGKFFRRRRCRRRPRWPMLADGGRRRAMPADADASQCRPMLI